MTEEDVDQLLDQGRKSEAIMRLDQMIVDAVNQGDFARAEELRLKLIAVDEMALTEIIHAAEVIEAAKSAVAKEKIDQLLAQGRKSEAIMCLDEMIVDAAERRDIANAEVLRHKLIATDEKALAEIIRAAEVIEAAKIAAIDSSYQEQWQELCSALSKDENKGLYLALKKITLKPGTVFIEQGKLNDRLFFISKGKANMVCQHGVRQFLFQQFKAGDIVGEDTFFGISICTTSVECQSTTTVKYLERRSLEAWQKSLPDLEEKLRSYCLKNRSIDYNEAAKNLERRRHTRFALKESVTAQLQNLKGQDIGVAFRGVLNDVSAGGVCFYVKNSGQGMARMLLGRPVCLSFSWINLGLYLRGVIVSSKQHSGNDYSVHVKLTNKNDPLMIELLTKLKTAKTRPVQHSTS